MSQTGQPWSPQTSQLHLFKSGTPLGSAWGLFLCTATWKLVLGITLFICSSCGSFLLCLMCSTLKTCRFTYFVCFVAVVIASDKKVNQHPLYLGCKAKLTCIHLKILSVVIENRDWFVSTPHHSATCCFHFFKN